MDRIEEQAVVLVSKWEHGTDEHREWLRRIAVPDIVAFAQRVRAEALGEAAIYLEKDRWTSVPGIIRTLTSAPPTSSHADVTRSTRPTPGQSGGIGSAKMISVTAGEAPPASPPADVARALARLFKMFNDMSDDLDGAPGWVFDFLRECGLREWMGDPDHGCSRLTDLGRAALAAADPQPLAVDRPHDGETK